jgi:hypothetical protein
VDINQKNILGDNVVNLGSPDREVDEALAKPLLDGLEKVGAHAVSIHFEDDAETADFAAKLATFLGANGYAVTNLQRHGQSGYQRGEVRLEPPSGDTSTAYLRVGPR